MPSFSNVRPAGRWDCSTSRMISSFSEAGYLIPRLPHPRSCLWNGPPLPPGEVVLPETQTEERMMKIAVLGIDLGKNVCSVVGLDSSGAVVLRRRVRRDTLIDLVAKLPACIVGMEACCGAHHLGRLFATQGHNIRLMSPEYVR